MELVITDLKPEYDKHEVRRSDELRPANPLYATVSETVPMCN